MSARGLITNIAFFASALAWPQVTVMDHVNPAGSLFTPATFNVAQIFPDFPVFSSTVVEDFDSVGGRVVSVTCAIELSSSTVNLANAEGWRVSFWSSVTQAGLSGNDLTGAVLSTVLVQTTEVQLTYLGGLRYLVRLPMSLPLIPGRIWVGVAPLLTFEPNSSQTFVLANSNPVHLGAGTSGNAFGVNPGEGFGLGKSFLVGFNAAYKVEMEGTGNGYLGRVVPADYFVRMGRRQSGDLQSLRNLDDDALRLCRFLVPNQTVAPVIVEAIGTAQFGAVPRLVQLVRSRSDNPGSFLQTIEFFDFEQNRYDAEIATTDINQSYTTVTRSLPIPSYRFMSQAGQVKSRLSFQQIGPTPTPNWCIDLDAVNWDCYQN